MRRTLFSAVALFLVLTVFTFAENSLTGLMFAFPAEGELLKQKSEIKDSIKIADKTFYTGKLEGKPIVLVEAGVGLVASAITTQILIDNFKPGRIIFTGICGSVGRDYKIGDIAIPIKWIIHDYGLYDSSGFRLFQTKEKRFIYHLIDANLIALAGKVAKDRELKLHPIDSRTPQIHFSAVGSSGNSFIDQREKRTWLKSATGADIVDMESAAVVQAANANNIPVLVIRSCSDLAGGSGSSTAEKELEEFFKVAADNSAMFVMEILKRIK